MRANLRFLLCSVPAACLLAACGYLPQPFESNPLSPAPPTPPVSGAFVAPPGTVVPDIPAAASRRPWRRARRCESRPAMRWRFWPTTPRSASPTTGSPMGCSLPMMGLRACARRRWPTPAPGASSPMGRCARNCPMWERGGELLYAGALWRRDRVRATRRPSAGQHSRGCGKSTDAVTRTSSSAATHLRRRGGAFRWRCGRVSSTAPVPSSGNPWQEFLHAHRPARILGRPYRLAAARQPVDPRRSRRGPDRHPQPFQRGLRPGEGQLCRAGDRQEAGRGRDQGHARRARSAFELYRRQGIPRDDGRRRAASSAVSACK